VDVVIPGLDELLRDSSVIDAEFKFDFADYLARHSGAWVKSLGEILERGLYHRELETRFRQRNAVERRDTEQHRRALIKRRATRATVEATLEEHRLVALVYPTLRRRPARIGDLQAGSNCQLSATSGLPALAVPAGMTPDGVPIGVDLLGAAFAEATLLSLGYAIEQSMQPRYAPFSTPPLVDGKAPASRSWRTLLPQDGNETVTIAWSYDVTTGRLSYRREALAGTTPPAIWLNRSEDGKPGAALHPVAGGAAPPRGEIALSFSDRRDLAEGKLQGRLYSRQSPVGYSVVPLVLP